MEIKTNKMKRAMFLIVFTIVTWWIFSNIEFAGKAISLLLGILAPFIIGIVIAFILNKPMSFIEEKLFLKGKVFGGLKEKYKRPISFVMTVIIFIIVIVIVAVLVVPNLIEAGAQLADKLPKYWEQLQDYAKNSSIKYSKINELVQDIDFDDMKDNIYNFVKGGFTSWIGSTFTVFSSVLGGIVSVGLGFVFAVYFLLQKETLILGVKKLTYAVFPIDTARKINYVGSITNRSFSDFLSGQSIEALIVGTMFFLVMMVFRFPYALMVSLIIGIFSFVPIVGSFIGLFIGTFLIFVESAKMAGFFIILFFALQQVEGNLIYPKVVGKASGLSSVWILAAVTLGGSLMGIIGIILFVPMFSVIQKLLTEFIDGRLEEKDIDTIKIEE